MPIGQEQSVTSYTTTTASSDCASDIALSWSLIHEDLQLMPEFTIENVMQYFVYRKENDGLERQDWKNFNVGGYKLFKEGHIQKIYGCLCGQSVQIKATCLPEMKKDRTYSLLLTIDKVTVDITTAQCTCPAGKGPVGSCKHIAALCFALEDFVKLREIILEQGKDACTSLLQKWNQPRKKRLDSKKVEDIEFSSSCYGKTKSKRTFYKACDPRPVNMQKTSKSELEEFTLQLETLQPPCGFLHLLSQPSKDITTTHLLPLTPRSVQARVRAMLFQSTLPPTWEVIQNYGKEFITGITPSAEEKAVVENKTRLQASALRWHEERFSRLTASNFGSVMIRKSSFDKLARDILFKKVPSEVTSIKWGRDNENTAFKEYEKLITQRYPNLQLRKSGFYIGDPAYLGASPDGVLEDTEGNLYGIIEIKCPFSAANLSVREACTMLDDFYCYTDENNDIKLNVKHKYYFQVQGTMAITNAQFCDFVVWTTKSMECIKIPFDNNVWISLLHKLKEFYLNYMLPAVLY